MLRLGVPGSDGTGVDFSLTGLLGVSGRECTGADTREEPGHVRSFCGEVPREDHWSAEEMRLGVEERCGVPGREGMLEVGLPPGVVDDSTFSDPAPTPTPPPSTLEVLRRATGV